MHMHSHVHVHCNLYSIYTHGMSTHIIVWAVITPGSPDLQIQGCSLSLYTGRAAILSISTAIPQIPTHKLHLSHARQGHSCSLIPHSPPHTHTLRLYRCIYNRKLGVVFLRAAIPLISVVLEQTSCLLHYYMYNTTCVRKFLYTQLYSPPLPCKEVLPAYT